MPVRVDGERVDQPATGGGYAESVKRLFPPGLSQMILKHQIQVMP